MDVPTATTSDLVAQFLDAKIAAGLSPKTIKTYRQRLARFVDWIADRPLTRQNLRAYLADLQRQPYSKPTVASYFRDVSVLCAWLAEEEVIPYHPGVGLLPKVPRRKPAHYTPAQVAQLLRVCDRRDRAIVVVFLDTGLRVSELVSLKRTSIDWQTGAFTVIGKGNVERTGWLGDYARAVLEAYIERRHDRNPGLFIGPRGQLKCEGVQKMLNRRCIEAGIRGDVRRLAHSFRVAFAKSYIQEGGDIETLRELLGHQDIGMSAYYAQLCDDELEEKKRAVNPLGRMIPAAKAQTREAAA